MHGVIYSGTRALEVVVLCVAPLGKDVRHSILDMVLVSRHGSISSDPRVGCEQRPGVSLADPPGAWHGHAWVMGPPFASEIVGRAVDGREGGGGGREAGRAPL